MNRAQRDELELGRALATVDEFAKDNITRQGHWASTNGTFSHDTILLFQQSRTGYRCCVPPPKKYRKLLNNANYCYIYNTMIRISEAIENIVTGHQALRFGFYHRLLNLSQVARFLRPSIEAQTRKEVTDAAILMNLSRFQQRLAEMPTSTSETLVLDKVNIQSGLCSVTLLKTSESHRELNRVFSRIQSRNGFVTVTEGMREITVIVEAGNLNLLLGSLSSKPSIVHRDLASVGMNFNERYLAIKGILAQMLEEVALQNINVIEVASTATEFCVFLKEDDVQLAFDAIFNRFGKQRPQR